MLDKKQKGAGGIHLFGLEGPGVDSLTQITMSFSKLTVGVKSIFSVSHKVYSKSELWSPLLGTSTSKLNKTKSSIDMVSSSNHFTFYDLGSNAILYQNMSLWLLSPKRFGGAETKLPALKTIFESIIRQSIVVIYLVFYSFL